MADKFYQGVTTIGERGQIVIPQAIRKALKLQPGDDLVVMSRGKKIIVVPVQEMESFYQGMVKNMEKMRKSLKR